VDEFKLNNVSQIGELMRFMLELRTFKLELHCFDTIIAMCVGNNNHFSCVIPPCFVSNNATVLSTMPQKDGGFSL
jgi:hypothetical protein